MGFLLKDGEKRIALGMSGGVDSSVAAALLQRAGWEVVGVTCVFTSDGWTAVDDARLACERLGIEHVVRDCRVEFEELVVAPFVRAYVSGLTPSPCVACNAQVKVPSLMRAADELGCAYVATGHYARVARSDEDRWTVVCAEDAAKDQSYMLAMLAQDQLARLVLPLGGATKEQVRALAAELGMPELAEKPESQDICFAPSGYRALLAERGASFASGPIMLDGREVGRHTGLADYTVGQRKGIGVAGPEPYYVTGKNAALNQLLIGTGEQARIERVVVGSLNWQAVADLAQPLEATVKLRYRSCACPCIIGPGEKSRVFVRLAESQPTTAPGQYAVFYRDSTVLGGGMIEEVCS